MKFKIKYSYEKDTGYSARHSATAFIGRYGIMPLHTAWEYSFHEAKKSLVEWLVGYKERIEKSRASKLEQKLNPPPPTEIIEL